MKNLLLILVLANILYFVWGMVAEDAAEPGIAIVSESELGPPLAVTTNRDAEAAGSGDNDSKYGSRSGAPAGA